MYRFFDFCIDCEFPLPGLPACEGGETLWRIRQAGRDFMDATLQPYHEWKSDDGLTIMRAARHKGSYWLDFLEMARFRVDFERREIEAGKLGDTPDSTLAHLLLDQALPRAVCHEGRAVIHASAVELRDGSSIAFTGPSGRGKSTLALAFRQAGCRVLSDDCLLLEPRADRVDAVPAYFSVRLWPDSLRALGAAAGIEPGRATAMSHYTHKQQVFWPEDSAEPLPKATGLRALYVLEDPEGVDNSQEFKVERLTGSAAIMTVIESQFTLDVDDAESVKRGFSTAGRIADQVNIYCLRFPRSFDQLPRVVARIRELTEKMPQFQSLGT